MITSAAGTPSSGEDTGPECHGHHPLRTRVIGVNSHDDIFTSEPAGASSIALSYHLEYHVVQTGAVIRVLDIPGAYAPHPALSGL